MRDRCDAVVVGGGHNGLVAAAYLARAGWSVEVLERAPAVGGAAISAPAFAGIDVRLSRYSYLVSLLPERIITDLGLRVTLRSRPVASYTPVHDGGLLVEADPGAATAKSFAAITGSDAEFAAWERFDRELVELARRLSPTLLEPLRPAPAIRDLIGVAAWDRFVERPLGELIEAEFGDDTVRGVLLTDGLIGTDTWAHDPSLRQNRCFLYHVIGDRTGEWRVQVGGMGAVTAELERVAREAGAQITTDAEVIAVESDDRRAEVTYRVGGTERRIGSTHVLAGVAPATLDVLLGRTPPVVPEGCQVKVNLLLTRLPGLRSGVDPRRAFAGTFHLDEGYGQLRRAYDDARAGRFPVGAPAELYCHTLTDSSILAPELAEQGWHTLTLFGLHTPARLFAGGVGNTAMAEHAAQAYLAGLNAYLTEPIEDCLARDADGRPCLEVRTPLDLERALGMPGGHIFHGDLSWPWAETEAEEGTWGVAVPGLSNVLLCGAGAIRGGGVSGIGGHNAARALLSRGSSSTAGAHRARP